MFSFMIREILDSIRYHDSHTKQRVGSSKEDNLRIPVCNDVFGVGTDHYF